MLQRGHVFFSARQRIANTSSHEKLQSITSSPAEYTQEVSAIGIHILRCHSWLLGTEEGSCSGSVYATAQLVVNRAQISRKPINVFRV